MKRIYRITRFKKSSTLADSVMSLCARQNSVDEFDRISLSEINCYIKCEKELYSASHKDIVCFIVNGNHLILQDGDTPLLEIQDIEVFEEVPTLDSYMVSEN
jgi:hypothetical protein